MWNLWFPQLQLCQLIQEQNAGLPICPGGDATACELLTMQAPEHQHPQQAILAIQAKRNNILPLVHHFVITEEKRYASIEPGEPPLETTLKTMHNTFPSDCPYYRFKESTRQDQSGLQFTLPAVLPQRTTSIMFAKIDPEALETEMVRCITAHQPWKRLPNPQRMYTSLPTADGY